MINTPIIDRRIRNLINQKAGKPGIKISIGEPNYDELRNGEEIKALVGDTLYTYTKVNNIVFKIAWVKVT
jgi:hypothetical protein